jgi:hypothetical protein
MTWLIALTLSLIPLACLVHPASLDRVTLTLDTHHPDGHPSRSCDGSIYRDGSNPILNAVHSDTRSFELPDARQ